MRHDKQNILVTRPLSGKQIAYARVLGLDPIIEPALEFEFPEYWDEVLRIINEHPKSEWVFTSTNGVKALEQLLGAGLQVRPETRIYAVGSRTRKALEKLGLEAQVPDRQNARHLAKLIASEGKVESVLYFHGNRSRDDLAEGLESEGIEVIGLEVYRTLIKEVYLPEKPVSAILFYSPSAVRGFAEGTGFEDPESLPPLFAIGPTTASAIREASGRQPATAEQPSTESLLKSVSDALFA